MLVGCLQYFDDQGNPLTNGLLGEELASNMLSMLLRTI